MMGLTLRDFDAETERHSGPNGLAASPADPVYTFTEEELTKLLAEARTQGHELGHADGLQEGRRAALDAQVRQRSSALGDIHDQLAQFLTQDQARRAELEADLIDMVLEICERVMPDLLRAYSVTQVQARLAEAIHMGSRQSTLTLRLSPATKDLLADQLRSLALDDNIAAPEIVEDPNLSDGEARVNWDNGFMSYSLDRVCADILEALRTASAQMQQENQKV